MTLVNGVPEAKEEPVHSPSLGGLCKDATESLLLGGGGGSVHTHLFACLLPSQAHVKSSTVRRPPAQNKIQLWTFCRLTEPRLSNNTGRGKRF